MIRPAAGLAFLCLYARAPDRTVGRMMLGEVLLTRPILPPAAEATFTAHHPCLNVISR
jgi:hypothetical protein